MTRARTKKLCPEPEQKKPSPEAGEFNMKENIEQEEVKDAG